MAWEPSFLAVVVESVPSLSLMQREELTRALQVEGLDMVRAELASISDGLAVAALDAAGGDYLDVQIARIDALLSGPLAVSGTSLSIMGIPEDY